MHQYAKCKNTPINFTILSDLIIENIKSICCFVNNIVVCWFDPDPKDWFVLLILFVFTDIDPTCEFFIFDEIWIWGFIKVLFKFVWVKEEADCLGCYGVKGKTWLGNYW